MGMKTLHSFETSGCINAATCSHVWEYWNSYSLFILVLSCRKNIKRMGLKMLN